MTVRDAFAVGLDVEFLVDRDRLRRPGRANERVAGVQEFIDAIRERVARLLAIDHEEIVTLFTKILLLIEDGVVARTATGESNEERCERQSVERVDSEHEDLDCSSGALVAGGANVVNADRSGARRTGDRLPADPRRTAPLRNLPAFAWRIARTPNAVKDCDLSSTHHVEPFEM